MNLYFVSPEEDEDHADEFFVWAESPEEAREVYNRDVCRLGGGGTLPRVFLVNTAPPEAPGLAPWHAREGVSMVLAEGEDPE